MTTKVIFKKFIEGDIIALFPNEIADPNNNIMSYQHIGQHGAASPDLLHGLEDAKPSEYNDLLKEIISIGYDDLKIDNKGV